MKNLTLLILFLLGSISYQVDARSRGSLGNKTIIKKVADLPNTDDYLADDGSGNELNVKLYLDLAIKYKIFGISSTPLWVVDEPVFVGINNFNKEDAFYELSNEEINAIIKENNLNRDEMLQLSLWDRHGGLMIIAVFIILYLLYLKFSPKEKEDVIEYANEEHPNKSSIEETKEEEKKN